MLALRGSRARCRGGPAPSTLAGRGFSRADTPGAGAALVRWSGSVLADDDARPQRQLGLGRLQGAGATRADGTPQRSENRKRAARRAGDRCRRGPRLGVGARRRLHPLPPQPSHRAGDEANSTRRDRGIQHLDRGRCGLGCRRPGRPSPAHLTPDEQDRRAHLGWRRTCRHGVRREEGMGHYPPRQHALPHRHGDERRDASRDRRQAAMPPPNASRWRGTASGSQDAGWRS